MVETAVKQEEGLAELAAKYNVESGDRQILSPKKIRVMLEAATAVSHHDPAVGKSGNTIPFNRAKVMQVREAGAPITQAEIDAICAAETVPEDVAQHLQVLSFTDFVAAAIIRQFIENFGAGDGCGLFTGKERYSRLQERISTCALKAKTLMDFWNELTEVMQVGTQDVSGDAALCRILLSSEAVQSAVISVLQNKATPTMTVGRYWLQKKKEQSEKYVAKMAKNGETVQTSGKSVALSFSADDVNAQLGGRKLVPVEIPTVQGNSIRHQLVRASGWRHFCRMLGIKDAQIPGAGILPIGAEGIFVNGGNIASGAKASGNTHFHAQVIRKVFPLLDLVGGCCDAFDLGESRLAVAGWTICDETRKFLPDWVIEAELAALNTSAFEFLDEATQTRMATNRGAGQMIYNGETMATGSNFAVELTLRAFTPLLTQGALMAALREFQEHAKIGGQERAGFGRVNSIIEGFDEEALRLYEEYLLLNKDYLLQELMSGEMGTGTKVLS